MTRRRKIAQRRRKMRMRRRKQIRKRKRKKMARMRKIKKKEMGRMMRKKRRKRRKSKANRVRVRMRARLRVRSSWRSYLNFGQLSRSSSNSPTYSQKSPVSALASTTSSAVFPPTAAPTPIIAPLTSLCRVHLHKSP